MVNQKGNQIESKRKKASLTYTSACQCLAQETARRWDLIGAHSLKTQRDLTPLFLVVRNSFITGDCLVWRVSSDWTHSLPALIKRKLESRKESRVSTLWWVNLLCTCLDSRHQGVYRKQINNSEQNIQIKITLLRIQFTAQHTPSVLPAGFLRRKIRSVNNKLYISKRVNTTHTTQTALHTTNLQHKQTTLMCVCMHVVFIKTSAYPYVLPCLKFIANRAVCWPELGYRSYRTTVVSYRCGPLLSAITTFRRILWHLSSPLPSLPLFSKWMEFRGKFVWRCFFSLSLSLFSSFSAFGSLHLSATIVPARNILNQNERIDPEKARHFSQELFLPT